MERITKKLINSCSNLARSSLRIVKATIVSIGQLFLWGVKELILEAALFGLGFGLAILFSSLGVSNSLALGLSVIILICILAVSFIASRQSKLSSKRTLTTARTQVRGEEKLADWIAQTLAQKAPQEWEEYQDWLHDILLARLQLLDRGYPVWKVRMITYWRLTRFCITVSLIKLKRLAISLRA